MRAHITVFSSAAGFLGCLTPLDLRTGIRSPGEVGPKSEVPTGDRLVGLDAYKIAVLISIAAAILSLCL
jgi:hypothetical protein